MIIDAATYVELEPELTMVPEVKEAMQSEPSEKFQTMAFGYVLSEKKEKEKSNVEEPSFRGPRLLSNAETGASSGYGPRAPRMQHQLRIPTHHHRLDLSGGIAGPGISMILRIHPTTRIPRDPEVSTRRKI